MDYESTALPLSYEPFRNCNCFQHNSFLMKLSIFVFPAPYSKKILNTLREQTNNFLRHHIRHNLQTAGVAHPDHVFIPLFFGKNVRQQVGHLKKLACVKYDAFFLREQGDIKNIAFDQILKEMCPERKLRN